MADLFNKIRKTAEVAKDLILPKSTDNDDDNGGQQQNGSSDGNFESGIYFRSHAGSFSGLIPYIDFFEPQKMSISIVGMFKKLSLSSSQNIFFRGCRALVSGLREKACDYFRKSIDKDPKLADAYFMLGYFEWNEKKYKAAEECFKKAMLLHGSLGKTIKPALPSLRMIMPITCNLSLAFYPDLIGVASLLALCHRCSQSENPAEGLEQVLDLIPGQSVISFILSVIFYEQGKREKIASMHHDLSCDSAGGTLNMLMLAKALSESGREEKAIEVISKALSSDALDPDLRKDFESLEKACRHNSSGRTAENAELMLFERLGIKAGSAIASKSKKAKFQTSCETAAKEITYIYSEAKEKKYRLYDGMTIGRKGDLDLPWEENFPEQCASISECDGIWSIIPESKNARIAINNFKITKKSSINIGDTLRIESSDFEFRQIKKNAR